MDKKQVEELQKDLGPVVSAQDAVQAMVDKIAMLEKRVEVLTKDRDEAQKSVVSHIKSAHAKVDEISSLNQQVLNLIGGRDAAINLAAENLKRANHAEKLLKECDERLKWLDHCAKSTVKERDQALTNLRITTQKLEHAKRDVSIRASYNRNLLEERNRLKDSNNQLVLDLWAAKDKLETITNKYTQCSAFVDDLKTELDKTKEDLKTVVRAGVYQEGIIADLNRQVRQKQSSISRQAVDIDKLNNIISQQQVDHHKLLQKIERDRKKHEQRKATVRELAADNKTLVAELASMELSVGVK